MSNHPNIHHMGTVQTLYAKPRSFYLDIPSKVLDSPCLESTPHTLLVIREFGIFFSVNPNMVLSLYVGYFVPLAADENLRNSIIAVNLFLLITSLQDI